ncbi:MAG: thiamine-monophosphate kinase [Nitrospirales bacterium]|nr:MAG: thiamine-monophosphate kinase [Nitrospirales bacterium]
MPRTPLRRTVSDLGEFTLLNTVQQILADCNAPSPHGIGDDAAILQPSSGHEWLVSKDLLLEGIHFDSQYATYREIGYKAAAVNISDMAAMGGTPQYLLIGLAVPPSTPLAHVRALYRGLRDICRTFRITVIGGDTCASRTDVCISITIIGTVKAGHALCRNGAQVGDHIYVTGTLGDSGAGLRLLQDRTSRYTGQLPKSVVRFLIQRHLHPTPQVHLGQILAKRRLATAAIDLSDGLSGDLRHLCQASHVGADIEMSNIPISSQCAAYISYSHDSRMKISLASGEDYQLLFTVSPNNQQRLKHMATRLGYMITRIGTIQPSKQGLHIQLADGARQALPQQSYDHFRSSSVQARL